MATYSATSNKTILRRMDSLMPILFSSSRSMAIPQDTAQIRQLQKIMNKTQNTVGITPKIDKYRYFDRIPSLLN